MTWYVEAIHNKPYADDREKLLSKRVEIEAQIKALASQPVGKTAAAARFRQEDLIKLASKIKSIDKKLGRTV